MDLDTIFLIVILIFSAIIHEVMHGVAADKLGDPTARYAGRLTLNPIPHIDPIGSIMLPLFFAFTHSPFFFAWAKPVPYNPFNLKPGRFSEAIVAGAGPASNFVLAILFAIIVRLNVVDPALSGLLFSVVVVNVMLGVFNLIPIPPLDGSKVLQALLPRQVSLPYERWRHTMEMNPVMGMGLVLLVVVIMGSAFSNFVYSFAAALAGV